MKTLTLITITTSVALRAATGLAQPVPPPPAVDLQKPYTDRHMLDVSHLRDFYNGVLIADAMIHTDGLFDAKSKWRLTLLQMILSGSNHYQARSAYQLSLMGVPLKEIRAMWSPKFIQSVKDPRMQAAYKYIAAVANLPTRVTADTHASLRMQFIDRQIAELFDMAAVNNALAVHDQVLPIATDEKTLKWARANLARVGWAAGRNGTRNAKERRARAFVGETLAAAQKEIYSSWQPHDLAAKAPRFTTDWINVLTGYGVSPVTFDADYDGIEDPFDAFPVDYNRWKKPNPAKNGNTPSSFDVAAYDYPYFRPASIPKAKYPFSDRSKFDTEWTRQSSLGTLKMDAYLLIRDRAVPVKMKWSLFLVYQLTSGCTHCQVHGAFGVFQELEEEYVDGEIPAAELPEAVKKIHALFDLERASHLTEGDRAALRLARDAGRLPGRTTAAHIEELRRHYTDREIQEMIATLILTGWLATSMQSQATVTDRLSMSWAMRHLAPIGWNPGVHIGLPHEQRPYHMSQLFAAVFAQLNMGEVADAASDWVGIDIPVAIDSDSDGVDDAFDGFPKDPRRWEDTDRDGIEDAKDQDIDGDGISNKQEVAAGTFPYKADSDADGKDDAAEHRAGTDPLDPRDY